MGFAFDEYDRRREPLPDSARYSEMGCRALHPEVVEDVEPRSDVDAGETEQRKHAALRVRVGLRRCWWAQSNRARRRVARIHIAYRPLRRRKADHYRTNQSRGR